MKNLSEFSTSQQEFIDQMARKMTVVWCDIATKHDSDCLAIDAFVSQPYLDYALSKKWLSIKSTPPSSINTYKILTSGWQTASRFLKR